MTCADTSRAIFFLGYFDRLLGTIVSYGIRWYTWRAYNAYIDIQALQISLLGGRIFFKHIRYHAHNETIFVHSGFITWHYWYRRVRDAEVYAAEDEKPKPSRSPSSSNSRSRSRSADGEEKGGVNTRNRQLPCRLRVQVEGVEAFIYNRSPVYDAIIESFTYPREKHATPAQSDPGSSTKTAPDAMFEAIKTVLSQADTTDDDRRKSKASLKREKTGGNKVPEWQRPDIPAFLKLFPIQVDCKIGAAVLGNENTRSILTAKFEGATGVFDAGRAGPLDSYKQIFNFEIVHPVISMRQNLDYQEPQLATAMRAKAGQVPDAPLKEPKQHRRKWPFFKQNSSMDSVNTAHSEGAHQRTSFAFQMPNIGQERWKGLTRYMDEARHNEHDEWDPVEYGRSSTLADIPRLELSFYWDIPGVVPPAGLTSEDLGMTNLDDINGSNPPAYGMDLFVRGDANGQGGTITYGPWADRQRADFQTVFIPANHSDAVPAKRLVPGDTRVATIFKLFLSIEVDTVVRIPLREQSKDWKWKGRADGATAHSKQTKIKSNSKKKRGFWRTREKGPIGANVRPFGWLDIKVAPQSTVTYTMDMVARKTGYHSFVNADIKHMDMFSSVNHGLLLRSGPLALQCDLSVPVRWNTLREWRFDITNDDLELFILRDHLFLLTDLIVDWGAGPLPDFYTFTPFKYLLGLKFRNLKLYLNTNDSNIINNPADLDDNRFVILYGRELVGDVVIPLDKFRPVKNEVLFDITARDLGLELCLNSRNTVATFTGRKKIAELDEVTLKGSHAYCSETSIELTDRLTFFIHGKKLVLTMFGFVVSHYIKIQENYFGEHLHFRTLEEFQELTRIGTSLSEEQKLQSESNRSNDLDVILCISADEISALLPANVYSSDENTMAEVSYASVDLRITNYYMDLQVDLSPLSVSYNRSGNQIGSRTELFIDSTMIVGHRLFGLPPTEPTYVCSWDIDVGKIAGECSDTFLDIFLRAIKCFMLTFDDDENATPLIAPEIVHDVTFLRVKTKEIKFWLHVGQDAILVSTNPVSIELNDWAGKLFSQRLNVLVPDITISCLDGQSASRRRTRGNIDEAVDTHALIRTTFSLVMVERKAHFSMERQQQQRHLVESDQRTHRTPFLILDQGIDYGDLIRDVDPPAMGYPRIPEPIASKRATELDSTGSSLRSSNGDEPVSKPVQPMTSKRPELYRQVSRASIKASLNGIKQAVRQMSMTKLQNEKTTEYRYGSSSQSVPRLEKEQNKRRLAPSSIALSSQLAVPYFPLHYVEPDFSDVPTMHDYAAREESDLAPLNFNDVASSESDEKLVQTSLIIRTEPGIQGFLKPQAITTLANLLDVLQPKNADGLLDDFQIAVVEDVMRTEKKSQSSGVSMEILVQIPQIALRFINVFAEERNPDVDQFDLRLTGFGLTLRERKVPQEPGKDLALAHGTLDSLTFHAGERPLGLNSEFAAISVNLQEVLVWLAASSTNTVNASFRSLAVETTSKNVTYLAGLVHRTTMLADSYVSTFSNLAANKRKRLHYLAYTLTMAGKQIPDPPFLLRASYVMRAAAQHLRNHDSWKIISRFRYIYESLSDKEKKMLQRGCLADYRSCPVNAESVVLNHWDQWRTWDLAHVRKSLAFQHLYGKVSGNATESKAATAKPLEVAVRSADIRIVVDPGPKQTELNIQLPVVNFSLMPRPSLSGLMLLDSTIVPTKRLTIETSSKSFILNINWQITQLVESLITIFQEGEHLRHADVEPSNRSHASTITGPEWIEIQAVAVVENAVIEAESINLKAYASSRNLNISILGNDRTATDDTMSGSILLHADVSRSEFTAGSRVLLRARSDAPNLYFSKDEIIGITQKAPALIFTAESKRCSVEVQEELLGMIEVVDAVVRDEVAYVQEALMPRISSGGAAAKKTGIVSDFPRISIALIVDSYDIKIALLQSLIYTLSGRTGRVSVSPGLHRRLALDMNFDLDEHEHDLTSLAHAGLNVLSALKLPPVNGQIKAIQTHDTVSVSVTTIIETIVLEASAVHGLFRTLQRPEVSRTFKAVQADIETITDRLKDIFPESSAEPPTVTASNMMKGRTLVYDISATMQGLKIQAEAPGKTPSAGVASLTLGLNCVQLKAFNSLDNGRTVLPLPEIHGRLRQLFVELAIKDNDGERRCGNFSLSAQVDCTLRKGRRGPRRKYQIQTDGIEVNIFAETASAVVDVLNHLQDKLKELDLSRERRYLRRLRQPAQRSSVHMSESMYTEASTASAGLFTSAIYVSLLDIQIAWIVGNSVAAVPGHNKNDFVLSVKMIDMATKSQSSSRLSIQDVMLQMVPVTHDKRQRYLNSALLPEMVFNVAYVSSDIDRKISFQAAGKSLDLRLEPQFIVPANMILKSISLAAEKFREATASWQMIPTSTGGQRRNPFGDKRLASLLVDIDFAGAVVHLQDSPKSLRSRGDTRGKYGQFVSQDLTAASLRSPGLAVRVQFKDDGADSSLNAELMISASSNTLTPTVVPLLLELSRSIKTVVEQTDKAAPPPEPKAAQSAFLDESFLTTNPNDLLGKTSLNLGVRICSQEFTLSCQPIARVSATGRFDDIYITVNSIKSTEHDNFFAISAAFEKLQASVQHVYSRQSTFSFEMERVVLSLMNSKHFSGTAGISAMLKIYPTRTRINARQLQDFLLFREIWLPQEIRQTVAPDSTAAPAPETQEYLVQRYQQVAAATAFPWNATLAIEEMAVELDLGQAIGKSSLIITDMWASSRKHSNWQQNLCIGIGKVGITSTGRMSGFVELKDFNVGTMIFWPRQEGGLQQTPGVQASIGFENLQSKIAFDYQPIAIADISKFVFIMYNVRQDEGKGKDRLVGILDGGDVHAYCTATSAAQALALFQAFERLVQENQAAYTQSLNEVEKHLRRQSISLPPRIEIKIADPDTPKRSDSGDSEPSVTAISLYTDVVVTLKSVNVGAFPSTFSDNQIFLTEASDVQARFAVLLEEDRIHSGLSMTLGQLRVALAAAAQPTGPKTLQEITVQDVVKAAKSARGGTILRVPKVVAAMQTWQIPGSYDIEYIFKSSFEGKVDVGWNYARIGFIRGIWNTHSRALASRLGKPLPESAVRITTGEAPSSGQQGDGTGTEPREGEKITAVVNVPQSKYQYHALEPPIIETPQLRDMGEATPPLEWIGLHRDRLPNLTHQIVIVALLGVAKEVEDAYERILGSS